VFERYPASQAPVDLIKHPVVETEASRRNQIRMFEDHEVDLCGESEEF